MFWKGPRALPIYHKIKNYYLQTTFQSSLKRAMCFFKCCIFAFAWAKVTRNTFFASASFLNREIHAENILNKFSSHYCNDVCLVISWESHLALALINLVRFSRVIDIFYILCWIRITPG